MALSPTYGVWLPGYLNTCNSPSPTGQQDAYGNNIPTPMTAGKAVQIGPNGVKGLTAPGTPGANLLYDGQYQWVNLDLGATASNAVAGNAAYIRVDSSSGSYPWPTVTTYDKVSTESAAGLLAGVFLNPATLNGSSNTVTPGNWTMIFVGEGRVAVNLNAAGGTPAIGDTVNADGSSDAKFTSTNTTTVTSATLGTAVTVPSTTYGCLVRVANVFGVVPN